MYDTEKEVLDWYEQQPRSLTKEYLSTFPWHEVKNYPLNPAFIPVLLYMRDIEYFTDMYHRELMRTPTGKDPNIAKFMERWTIEELNHAEVLNRFLNEAGFPTSDKWQAEATAKIPWSYTFNTFLMYWAVKPFGKYFAGAHMAWGAINEITTLHGYRRLAQIAGHPVLAQLLMGVMHEESIHSNFYWNIAKIKLREAKFARDLARFSVSRFWAPVGQGPKLEHETNYVVSTLFPGQAGLDFFDRAVSSRVERLPGFSGFKKLTERMAPIVLA